MTIPFAEPLSSDFFWLSKPRYELNDGNLVLFTENRTDFWQRTHYGFSKDDGHALLTSVTEDFTMTVRTSFRYASQYDQCGLLLRIDALNWIKISTEWEDEAIMRLGSVVTNLGYSDWATVDIDGTTDEMWFRVSGRENDFTLESARDGRNWSQMRISHLHSRQRPLNIGLYACSPKTGGFRAQFSDFSITTDPKE
jgi:uncharacterized protein